MKYFTFSISISLILIAYVFWVNYELVASFNKMINASENTLSPTLVSLGKSIKMGVVAIGLIALTLGIQAKKKKEKLAILAIIIALIAICIPFLPIFTLFTLFIAN